MSSSSGSSRCGRSTSPRVAASSCCVRCRHSRKPVRSLALRMSRPPVTCMSGVELQLSRRLGLAHRFGEDAGHHIADLVAVGGAKRQLGEARELARVVRQVVAFKSRTRTAALEAEAAEGRNRGLAWAARVRHPVLGAFLAQYARFVDDELDVALGVAGVLEDNEVVLAQLMEESAEFPLVDLQSHLSFHASIVTGLRDSSVSRFQLRLRLGGAKRVAA